MTLKLGEPLDYDYVDELLDNNYMWVDYIGGYEEGCPVVYHNAFLLNENFNTIKRSTFSNLMFELKEDEEHLTFHEEDEEGYIHYRGHFTYTWKAEEMTEEEIDKELRYV